MLTTSDDSPVNPGVAPAIAIVRLRAAVAAAAIAAMMPIVARASPIVFTNFTTANGLPDNKILDVYVADGKIYAATIDGGLGISSDGGASWSHHLPSTTISSVFARGSSIYVASHSGVSISGDGGATWTTSNASSLTGLPAGTPWGIHAAEGLICVGSNDSGRGGGGVSVSTDGGASWSTTTKAQGLGADEVFSVYCSGGKIYAATNGGLSISADAGATFSNQFPNGWPPQERVFVDGDSVYSASVGCGVSISHDGGASWTRSSSVNGLGSDLCEDVFAHGTSIYAATRPHAGGNTGLGGLSISTDDGANWTTYTTSDGLGSNWVSAVYVSGGRIYAATQGGLSIATIPSGVPEIDPAGMGSVLALVTGALGLIERRRLKAS